MEAQEIADRLMEWTWANASADAKREFGRVAAHAAIYGHPAPREEVERVARLLVESATNR